MATSAEIDTLVRLDGEANVAGPGAAPDIRKISAVAGPGAKRPEGPLALIYVHGSPGAGDGWADFLLDPVGSLPSLAIDRPGYGKSDRASLPSLEGHSRALAPFLPQNGRVILIGHSYGGPVVLQAAIDYPDRVAGICVLAGSVAPELEKRRWFNYLAKGLSWFLPRNLRRSNQEIWPLRSDLERLETRLGEIHAPVSIVHGTDDSLVPIGNVDFLAAALTGAASITVDRLEGIGHMFIWEEPGFSRTRSAIEGLIEAAE